MKWDNNIKRIYIWNNFTAYICSETLEDGEKTIYDFRKHFMTRKMKIITTSYERYKTEPIWTEQIEHNMAFEFSISI